MDKVAILLSTYNGEKFLNEQLQSIFNQKDVDIIVYVRDDGSTDKTIEILNNWRKQLDINFIKDDKNVGPAKSFWELCKNVGDADYYAFCDQDDVWDDDKLRVAIDSIKKIKKPALYFCKERNIDSEGRLIPDIEDYDPIVTFESEIVCGFCPGCALVFNKKLKDIVVEGDYNAVLMHDMLFVLNAFIHGEVVYDNNPHFSRRVHANNAVATDGRSWSEKIVYKFKKQFSKRRIKLDRFVDEIYENNRDEKYDFTSLLVLINYKHNIANKIKLLCDKRYVSKNRKGLRSFRIKVIMGWL